MIVSQYRIDRMMENGETRTLFTEHAVAIRKYLDGEGIKHTYRFDGQWHHITLVKGATAKQ